MPPISRLPRFSTTRWSRLLLALLLIAATVVRVLSPSRAASPSSPLPAASRAPAAPIARTAGTTAALVVAYKGDVPAALLTPANLRSLGVAFHNTIAHGSVSRVAPLPVLLLGTRQTPTVKAEGMSGGPLVLAQRLLVGGHDLLGQVIGVNIDYARPASTGPQSISINPALNLNLALPSNTVRQALGILLKLLHPGPYTLPH